MSWKGKGGRGKKCDQEREKEESELRSVVVVVITGGTNPGTDRDSYCFRHHRFRVHFDQWSFTVGFIVVV